jgi:hypothetical protein
VKSEENYALLGTVIGASVGALIGLAFIQLSLWWTLVGAIVGAPVGFRFGVSGTQTAHAMDDAGLGALGCLIQLWLGTGCIGCGCVTSAILGFILFGAILLSRGPVAALHFRHAQMPTFRVASLRDGARGRRLQSLRGV